ncbi:MAG TPA: hypothetical protein VHQ65_13425 [Thermoanaerobaculia bacterium]|nr:hypothetical protein [Thermoanaerobaculia bacterium]
MDCKRAREMMYVFVDERTHHHDGALRDDELAGSYWNHLDDCGHCKQKAVFTRRVVLVVRQRCARHSAPQRLRERIQVILQRHVGSELH